MADPGVWSQIPEALTPPPGESVAKKAVSLVGRVVALVVGVFVVLLPWAFDKLVVWDPTWVPRRPGSRWVGLDAQSDDARRRWRRDPRTVRTTWRRRLHRLLQLAVVAGAVVLAVLLVQRFA
jgi:H+/Cl- antiporter ClcA